MEIAILGQRNSWHVGQLTAAAQRLGYRVQVVPFRQLTASLGPDESRLRWNGFDPLRADRVLVRGIPGGSLEQIVFRLDALHRLQLAGIRVLNPPAAIEACVDKYLATARLQAAGLPVPRTAVCEQYEEAMEAFERLGKDIVIKPLFGSEGRGILHADSEALAHRVFQTLCQMQCVLYLQEYIEHPGYDVRVMVLGKRVVASMQRHAQEDFRTNAAQGGRCVAWQLPDGWSELAVRAAEAIGAPLTGVDLLPDRSGRPLVVEANSTPGFQALTQVTGVDIAHEIIEFLVADD